MRPVVGDDLGRKAVFNFLLMLKQRRDALKKGAEGMKEVVWNWKGTGTSQFVCLWVRPFLSLLCAPLLELSPFCFSQGL